MQGRSQGVPPASSAGPYTGKKRHGSSSQYFGVCWGKAKGSWQVQLMDPQTKKTRHIGYFASEEEAARAYDSAAVQANGPGAERNFPGEDIIELPQQEEQKKERCSSRYIGVCWNKRKTAWEVQLTDPRTQRRRRIGAYATEEEAARAYDFEAEQALGSGAKRNFPDEAASEPAPAPAPVAPVERTSSYIGVTWSTARSSWLSNLTDAKTKQWQFIGYYDSEEDAARAYDCAAFQARGPSAKLNFPGEPIIELPADA